MTDKPDAGVHDYALAAAVIVALSLSVTNLVVSMQAHSVKAAANPPARVPAKTIRWCDRLGWADMSSGACQALSDDTIPLPAGDTCPGSYVLWKYNQYKPAICVRES